ncbi:hypothetical protein L9F63_002796 [Diploptera punctata]|uniref:HAUS augmin-like complex subunit 3 N-terminal domain-containing protein n=1 Tax=Diploptera punctata TaxID=6984 RepID=A0AAD7ZT63_DIPPU|nr:hypothetical protein L9F63_002796 [Diploptera punctata]
MSHPPDVLKQLEGLVEDIRNEYCCGPNPDVEIEEFLTHLCNSIDSRNVLTASEIKEYEEMIANGEDLDGVELENAYSNINIDDVGNDYETQFLIEEIERADSHIQLLSELTKKTNEKCEHITSGIRQLEKQEKSADYNLLAEQEECRKLENKVHSLQKKLIRQYDRDVEIGTDYILKNPQFIAQMPYETFKKFYFQFDQYARRSMNQLIDLNKDTGKSAMNKLDDLEQSYIEVKVKYLSLSAEEKAKKEVIKLLNDKINNIQSYKNLPTIDDLRNQTVLFEDEANRLNGEVVSMIENVVVPTVMEEIEREVLNVKKYRNEHTICKQKHLYKQLETLAKCMDSGLLKNELLVLLFAIERQKVSDIIDLNQQCREEINEEYSQFLLRMKAMQDLKENKHKNSLVDNPLIRYVGKILDGGGNHSYGALDYSDLASKVKKIKFDLRENEEMKLSQFNRQRSMLIQSERFLINVDASLCSGLAKKVLIHNVDILRKCAEFENLMESYQEALIKFENKFEEKKTFLMKNPLHQEQRLLWIYFSVDPKKLVSLIDYLQEQYEKKFTLQNRKATTFHGVKK